MPERHLFSPKSHPAPRFWEDLTHLARLSDEALTRLEQLLAKYPSYEVPEADLEKFIHTTGLDLHEGISVVSLPGFIRARAAPRGLNGEGAVASLIDLAPSEEQRGLIKQKVNLLAKLFEPHTEGTIAVAAALQRLNPLPTLRSIAFAWEARGVFLSSEENPELRGLVPLMILRLTLSGPSSSTSDQTVVLQMTKHTLSSLITELQKAEVRLTKLEDRLAATDIPVMPEESEDELEPASISWEVLF